MRFLLVDRILEASPPRALRGVKQVTLSEDHFTWHFPGRPIMPGMLVLEACAQLAGWLEAASSDFERWFLLERVASARYYGFAVPGDRLTLALERSDEGTDAARRAYIAEADVDGRRTARLEFSGCVVPLAGLDDPLAVRRVYADLTGARR